MKLYNILLLLFVSLLLTSCITSPETHPVYDSFVCSINADGTGFQKLVKVSQLPFDTSQLWDMYVTQNGKLIFDANYLYIIDPDSLGQDFLPSVSTDYGQRYSLSNDNKVYYCSEGMLYQFDLQTNTTRQLTDHIGGDLMNPIISPDNSIVTLFRNEHDSNGTTTLCYYRLLDDSLIVLPQAGTATHNGIYNPNNGKIYHEQNNGLYQIDLDGTNKIHCFNYFTNGCFGFGLSSQKDHIVSVDVSKKLSVFNILNNTQAFTLVMNDNRVTPKITYDENKVFYVLNGSAYFYDINDHQITSIPHTEGLSIAMCPTWDGSKIYFIANLRVNK